MGAFDLLFSSPADLSHAAPVARVDDADALAAEIAGVTEAFVDRGLRPRFEFSFFLWPDLPPMLGRAGYRLEEQTPLLVAHLGCFRPRTGAALRWVDPGEDLAFIGSVMRQGLEIRGRAPSPDEIAALRESLELGLGLAYAELEGRPAGTGCSFSIGPTTEISAVSTIPTRRRRGVAASLVSFLVGEHFARGGTLAWAASHDPAAHGLLQSLGFDDAGTRVSYAL